MMISDGETKGSDLHHGESHAFPLLKNNAVIEPTGSSGESDDCFKPLYHPSAIDGNLSVDRGVGVCCPGEERNSEKNARQESFERGFEAGKHDACSLVQEETAPQIKLFADAFSLWNALMIRVEEKSNLQIFKMAVAVAEKILGSPPQYCTGRLESLKADLTTRMRKAYQLEFKLNPKDRDALSRMIACENVQWEQWEYITATGDADVHKGALLVEPGPQTLSADADDGILRSLNTALSEEPARVSTK
jgi:hypothetical protein